MLSVFLLVLAVTDGGVAARVQTEARPGPAGEVSGVVEDERGAPIAGAKLQFRTGVHHRVMTTSAETGADGRFTASGVRDGSRVQVDATGFVSMVHTLEAGLQNGALTLNVRLGRPVKLAGVIAAPDATDGALRLRDVPPAGVDLQKWRMAAQPRAVGVLAPDGAFALEAVAGDYELEWSRPAGRPFWAIVHAPSQGLRLSPSTAVLTGQVLDATGAPVVDAEVFANDLADVQPAMVARTDAQGRFKLRGVEDGEHLVQVTSKDVCHWQKVKVAKGVGAVTVRFGRGWRFEGQVLDGEGRGLGTSVIVTPAPAKGGTPGGAMAVVGGEAPVNSITGGRCDARSVRSDESGRFSITDLAPAEVDVTALSVPAPAPVRVKKGGGPVILRLPPPAAR